MPRALICNRPHMRATPGRTIRPTGKAPACKLSSIHEPITYRAVPLGTVQDSLHGASGIWRGERGSWRGLSCIRCTTSVETRIRTSPPGLPSPFFPWLSLSLSSIRCLDISARSNPPTRPRPYRSSIFPPSLPFLLALTLGFSRFFYSSPSFDRHLFGSIGRNLFPR